MKLFKNNFHTTAAIDENEIELINNVINGDKYAFKLLMNKYSSFVAATAYKVLWDNDDTEDVVQETFIKVWKNIKSYKNYSMFTTWLYKISINTAYDKLRSRKRREKVFTGIDEKLEHLIINFDEKDISDRLSDIELVNAIKYLSGELSPVQKVVFTMVDLEKQKTKEVSEILDMNESAVKANLSHARKKIREKLANYIKQD